MTLQGIEVAEEERVLNSVPAQSMLVDRPLCELMLLSRRSRAIAQLLYHPHY